MLHDGQAGNLVASLESLVGPAAVQFFQQLISRTGARGEIVGLEVPSAGIVATVDRAGNIHRHMHAYTSVNERPTRDSAGDSEAFSPAPTSIRWSDEIKITQGGSESSRAARLGQRLIVALLPAAKKALHELETAEKQRQQEEEESRAKPRDLENPGTPEINPDAGEATDTRVQGSVVISTARPVESVATPPGSEPSKHSPDASAELVDNAAQAMQGISVTDDPAGPEVQEGDSNSIAAVHDAPSQDPAPGSSRVHVQIHGNSVDITDTGIDPAFLEALPDDMREEVLNQQLREQRSAAAAAQTSRDHESQINPEFLDALPPEIRAELLDQEAEQMRRRATQTAPAVPVASTGPVEIDSATFLASLDPGLRQVVLMEQDETFLETLPPALLAEVSHYREADQNRFIQSRQPREQVDIEAPKTKKVLTSRDSIHLLDKSGVATLIRLLFYPQVLRKNTLQKVLINLCENSKTRAEVYNSILTVLVEVNHPGVSEGPAHALLQRDTKTGQNSAGKSPLKLRFSTSDSVNTSATITKAVHESGLTPQLVLQRCIESLNDIASASEISPIFFLTEQQEPSSWKKGSSKKGKGKEKVPTSTSYFPLSLLLSLLDSQFFQETPWRWLIKGKQRCSRAYT